MPTPRELQIDLSVTPYYRCISTCFRKAFLCGKDNSTGQNFDHRKAWFVAKMKSLTQYFTIEICAYAVMSNHYHLVLKIDQEKVHLLTSLESLKRWGELFPMSKAAEILSLELSEKQLLKSRKDKIEQWRNQLFSVSWFMRVLDEGIARLANQEDDYKGRFWESRFKSQALLDDSVVLANPIRA